MSFKVTKETDKSFHVEHADGTKFQIAKLGLKPEMIQKIKRYSDGGEVEEADDEEEDPAPQAGATPAPEGASGPPAAPLDTEVVAEPTQGPNPQKPLDVEPIGEGDNKSLAAEKAIGAAQRGEAAPAVTPAAPQTATQKALEAQSQGIETESKAKQQFSKATASAYDQYLKNLPTAENLATQVQNIATEKGKIQTDLENLHKEAMANPIDPKRFWNNLETSQKIGVGVSMILGGIGAGMSGKDNPVLKMMNDAQDKDIESQKANLAKGNNLMSQNMQRYRDLGAAEAATRLQQGTVLSAQIDKEAAKANTPMAQAAAAQAKAILGIQMAQNANQLAVFKTSAQQMGLTGQSGGIPEGQVPPAMAMQPDYQKKKVVFAGREYQATDPAKAEEINKMLSAHKQVQDDVAELKKIGLSPLASTEAKHHAEIVMNRLGLNVAKFNGIKRFSPATSEAMQKMFSDPTSLAGIVSGQGSSADTLRAMNVQLHDALKSGVPGYQGAARYDTRK